MGLPPGNLRKTGPHFLVGELTLSWKPPLPEKILLLWEEILPLLATHRELLLSLFTLGDIVNLFSQKPGPKGYVYACNGASDASSTSPLD